MGVPIKFDPNQGFQRDAIDSVLDLFAGQEAAEQGSADDAFATEAMLERAIDRLLADRTAIVIAHRLHTLHRVDDVMVLDEGRVVEHGPRDALAADPTSRFAHLLVTGMEEVLT